MKSLDEAIRTLDASIDYGHLADYLWTWEDVNSTGNPIREVFNDKLDKFPGPHDPEHKTEAYRWAANEALKELDSIYSKLKSEVDRKLRNGYNAAKITLQNMRK